MMVQVTVTKALPGYLESSVTPKRESPNSTITGKPTRSRHACQPKQNLLILKTLYIKAPFPLWEFRDTPKGLFIAFAYE